MTINYMIRFKIGALDRIMLYLLASKMFTWPILNLCEVLSKNLHNHLILNATPTAQPAKATTGTKPLTTSLNTNCNNYTNYISWKSTLTTITNSYKKLLKVGQLHKLKHVH